MLSRVSTSGEVPHVYELNRPELADTGLSFGRNTDNDFVLFTDALPLLISRKHARLVVVDRTLRIQDTGSTNGTYVNEARLRRSESRQLANGDVISFGGPKHITRDGQQHNNPFIYTLSGVQSVTGQRHSASAPDLTATAGRAVNAALRVAHSEVAQLRPAPEAVVDLTGAGPLTTRSSNVVDLTDSPDAHASSRRSTAVRQPSARQLNTCPSQVPSQQQQQQQQQPSKRQPRPVQSNALAGQKRSKSEELAAGAAADSRKPSPDGGAKQALENEFECTICRDFMVVTHSVVPCGHMFCGECLSTWLQRSATCPKCRSAATAPPVRAMAVDNVLETLVEKNMSAEDLQHRQQRKQHWQTHAASIDAKMKRLFQPQAPPAIRQAQGHPSQAWAYQALADQARAQALADVRAMQGRVRPRHVPPAVQSTSYLVQRQTSQQRVLCKACRLPIIYNSPQIGYCERDQMRWYHLGCLSSDRWREAADRLVGLPHLEMSHQQDVAGRVAWARNSSSR